MGAGWLGLVTPERAHLVTSVAYPPDQTPFAAVDNLAIATGKEALSPFLRDILLAPPDPPYLLFASGNSSVKVMRGLAVTRSNRRVHISGNDPAIVDAIALKDHFLAWKKSGVSASTLKKAAQLRDDARYAYDPRQQDRAHDALEKMLSTRDDFRSLLRALPPTHSDNWRYLLRLANLESST